MRLLGRTKLESTVGYLVIEVDDALSISQQIELRSEHKYGLSLMGRYHFFRSGLPGLRLTTIAHFD